MAWKNKVIWSEGMFLRPQHFQQYARYVENLVETRCGALRSYAWGFTELQLDTQLLTLGKLSIGAARGGFSALLVTVGQDDTSSSRPAGLNVAQHSPGPLIRKARVQNHQGWLMVCAHLLQRQAVLRLHPGADLGHRLDQRL